MAPVLQVLLKPCRRGWRRWSWRPTARMQRLLPCATACSRTGPPRGNHTLVRYAGLVLCGELPAHLRQGLIQSDKLMYDYVYLYDYVEVDDKCKCIVTANDECNWQHPPIS